MSMYGPGSVSAAMCERAKSGAIRGRTISELKKAAEGTEEKPGDPNALLALQTRSRGKGGSALAAQAALRALGYPA